MHGRDETRSEMPISLVFRMKLNFGASGLSRQTNKQIKRWTFFLYFWYVLNVGAALYGYYQHFIQNIHDPDRHHKNDAQRLFESLVVYIIIRLPQFMLMQMQLSVKKKKAMVRPIVNWQQKVSFFFGQRVSCNSIWTTNVMEKERTQQNSIKYMWNHHRRFVHNIHL